MILSEAINELKYCTALMLRAYGDHSKTLSYYLVKSLDFYDPNTDPMEVLRICGYMLETIRMMAYTQAMRHNIYEAIDAKKELDDINLRPMLSDNFSYEDFEVYKKKTLDRLTISENYVEQKANK